ncbi:MAG: Fur family transcriptional regulator [Anaerolineae bacterium]
MMTKEDSRFEAMLVALREHDYRLTPQRLAVVRLLAESEAHLSAAQIHERLCEQFPTMSLATVYRTLNVLKEVEEVLELRVNDDEHRYDGRDPRPHPHVICVRCRKIIDFEIPGLSDLAQKVVAATGFQVTGHRLDFFGVCPDCQRDESL